jgi:signal-transduction protein with cAMP-binding, CBS, and nucleotidyltransferase domain
VNVSEVMTEASVTDSPTNTLRSAAATMWRQQTGSLLVIEDGELVGIVTERDVLKAVARGVDAETTPVADVMTKAVQTVSTDTSLHEAARMMAAQWIRHLPIQQDGKVVGVLSQRDLVGIFAALDPEPNGVPLASDELVRVRRLVRIEHGDLD